MSNRKKEAKKEARSVLERLRAQAHLNWDVQELKEAAHYHWMGDFGKAGRIFFPLMDRLIQEPLKGTKEYEDGQRKPETPVEEQEQEEVLGEVVTFTDLFGDGKDAETTEDPRDEDGYLIR